MVAARPWRIHSSCLFIVVTYSWQLLVHGGRSSMCVHGSCSFIVVAHSWRLLVHGGCSFMATAHSSSANRETRQFARFVSQVSESLGFAGFRWVSLRIPCQISFAGDSLNSLTGVILSMDMME